jgi:hypothetical protein
MIKHTLRELPSTGTMKQEAVFAENFLLMVPVGLSVLNATYMFWRSSYPREKCNPRKKPLTRHGVRRAEDDCEKEETH